MSQNKRVVKAAIATAGVCGMLALSACGAAKTGQSDQAGESGKTVKLTVPSWVGAQANVAVAQNLLENELGYKVKTQQMGEVLAWDALAKGNLDAIMEDWGHPAQEKKYIDDKKAVVKGGDLGVTGHIGWFVPKYFADKHPDVKDFRNLNKYADQLKTSESDGKGQILEGSPDYVTNDAALIKNHKLNFKPVYAGSEAAQITEIKKNVKEKKPFLTYWWTPQWLNNDIELTEVKLPEYKDGCDKDTKKITCGYPKTPLQKFLNADFAKDGGKAAQFLKNFKWTTEQQNEVAKMIAGEKMSPEAAAEKWVKENPDTWKQWIPKG
ncbi:ABC transporter substrate-binding protein [Streptomyces meridianus]|uniref:ABC transporter substrate-binding protein n=1 Tax=Streptomyces meridianus TaxID=2938945 RepID=A0ABT0X601_9ACTN|nr:ABC transporter substrate-binding protein [Streptomyces meridianus]MCM2577961.1 ABC transporter substrate-binding protein [Streptomyces meridianus]